MIEKMKAVYIVAQNSRRTEMLDTLRELGVLHLAERKDADSEISNRFATLSRLSLELKDYVQKDGEEPQILSDDEFEKLYNETVDAISRKSELQEKKTSALLEYEKIKAWGDFDPQEIKRLKDSGFDFHFYRIGKKECSMLEKDESVSFIRLKSVEKLCSIAVIGSLGSGFAANEFVLPAKGASQLKSVIETCETEICECDKVLKNAARYLKSYSVQLLKTQNNAEYSSVDNTLDGDGDLIWLAGYIPQSDIERFVASAKSHGWAWHIEDAAENDANVPTKIKYNKLTVLMKPVFEILGTVPGYGEYDISFWFLAFFTLFFAMIIGDAGYGVLFLLGAVGLTVKTKKVTNITLLLYVLSFATVIWGAMTGTWFGLEGAMKVPFLKALVIPSFANYPQYFGIETSSAQNSVMKFCFSIGVIQLALACIMNIRRKITRKDLSLMADIGWLIAICALYFTVLYLVIGQKVNIAVIGAAVGIGFLLVVFFGGMSPDKSFSKGLKSGLGDTFTVFLNTISAFGNVMSYIRLFAVGMASLAIAQSFNNMAAGFKGPLVIIGVIIMVIGHLLNIVMGFLSVVVHGVRLNLLEFSGQLGMEWSGTAYSPFCNLKQLKK